MKIDFLPDFFHVETVDAIYYTIPFMNAKATNRA